MKGTAVDKICDAMISLLDEMPLTTTPAFLYLSPGMKIVLRALSAAMTISIWLEAATSRVVVPTLLYCGLLSSKRFVVM